MLQVRSISRSFQGNKVLDGLSFEAAAGRITGFVGANGSGKTTTMRIILGVLAADGGTVTWQGAPITQQVRQRFGYMPEERGLYPKMKVAEQIVYLGRLHGLDLPTAKRSTAALLERLELSARADDPVERLSLGNQQRVQICAALVHEPDLLILDEPFSGLDPLAIETVLGVMREAAARGVPVLFSSHQLELVERLCDDLVIISGGTTAASGDRRSLQARFATPRFELEVDGDAAWVSDLPGVEVVKLDGGHVVFDVAENEQAQRVLEEAVRRGPVRAFGAVVPSLAEIFREVI